MDCVLADGMGDLDALGMTSSGVLGVDHLAEADLERHVFAVVGVGVEPKRIERFLSKVAAPSMVAVGLTVITITVVSADPSKR